MPETHPGHRVTAAERRAQVVALRRGRATFDQIGRALGISKQRAHELYKQALAEIPAAQVSEHRAEELMLIDDAIRNLMPIARDHTRPRSAVEAWNAIRGWAERKARLLGLDAPRRQAIEVITSDVIAAEITRLEAELGPPETWDRPGIAG
jgi:Sigma-70, region 4